MMFTDFWLTVAVGSLAAVVVAGALRLIVI